MKKERRKMLCVAVCMFAAFLLWTVAICLMDVEAIGPQGSAVGLATLNKFVHNLTGVHMQLYVITDWLGLVPLIFGIGFALLGLVQWIQRKHIGQVDRSILALGGFYVVVMAAYVFFECVVVNYRPVLINGILEASYPSSTTLLVLCVMLTALMQLRCRIKNPMRNRCVTYSMAVFVAFMVIGRLISGVHWFTDIIGGVLLSLSLVALYCALGHTL